MSCRQVTRALLAELDHYLTAGRYTIATHAQELREFSKALDQAIEKLDGKQSRPKTPTFDATVEAVTRELGRSLTRSERLIAEHMHLGGKSAEEITRTLK